VKSTVNVTASDADSGIDSVTLFYRPAGESNWRSKSMSEGDPDHYSASINSVDENIDADISIFVEAVDKEGNDAQSRGATIQVELCIT
jgi:hypothetical protein